MVWWYLYPYKRYWYLNDKSSRTTNPLRPRSESIIASNENVVINLTNGRPYSRPVYGLYENYKAINYDRDKLSNRGAIIERTNEPARASSLANPDELLVNLVQVRNIVDDSGCGGTIVMLAPLFSFSCILFLSILPSTLSTFNVAH